MNTKKEKEREYRQNPAVSNSSLGWLEISPQHFVARVNRDIEEESTKSLDIGTLVHILALEPDRIQEYAFVPKGIKFPSSSKQKEMCKAILEAGMDIEEGFIYMYPDYYTIKGKSDNAIKKAVQELCRDLSPYIDFKAKSEGKTIISNDDFELATLCEHNLLEHKKANELLFESQQDAYNELEIYFKTDVDVTPEESKSIDCKAKIDRLIINHEKKEVYLIDLKTTSKMASLFRVSANFYDYDRQLAFYKLAVESYLRKNKLKGYKILSYFVVVETIGFNEVYVYRVPESVTEKGKQKYLDLLEKLAYHMDNGFEYPKEYYEGDGSVELIME